MVGKRPCGVCGRWFRPSKRQGERQRVCSTPDCQRERHRRSCAEWHLGERKEEALERARHRLVAREGEPGAAACGLRLDALRSSMGAEMELIVVQIQETVNQATRR